MDLVQLLSNLALENRHRNCRTLHQCRVSLFWELSKCITCTVTDAVLHTLFDPNSAKRRRKIPQTVVKIAQYLKVNCPLHHRSC